MAAPSRTGQTLIYQLTKSHRGQWLFGDGLWYDIWVNATEFEVGVSFSL